MNQISRRQRPRSSVQAAVQTAWMLAGILILGGCASTVPDCACAANPGHPGCQEYVPEKKKVNYALAEARFGAALGKPRDVEINKTKTYSDKREGLESAAIRPPDTCLTESAAEVEGEAKAAGQELMSTQCGVWLSEIEKALVRSGFRVVSWDALHSIERNEKVPPYKAAKKLGADVLFLFNSLELNPIEAGGESAYRIEYFRSNEGGERGAPFPMTESERSVLRQAVTARVQAPTAAGETAVLSSTLDSTAILTENGESIWFYRNTALKTLKDATGKAFLFAKYEDGDTWYLAHPEREEQTSSGDVVAAPERKSAVDTGGSVQDPSRDALAVERLELMRSVTKDFVERFRTGQEGDGDNAQ